MLGLAPPSESPSWLRARQSHPDPAGLHPSTQPRLSHPAYLQDFRTRAHMHFPSYFCKVGQGERARTTQAPCMLQTNDASV